MKELQALVNSLEADTKRDFENHLLSRGVNQPKESQRKDLLLFGALVKTKNEELDGLIEKMYGKLDDRNRNAFHAVKKRLKSDLRQFVVEREAAESIQTVDGWIVYTRYLFDHNYEEIAWKALEKAESIAQREELNEKLNEIYDCQLAHCHLPGAPELNSIENKKSDIRQRIEEDDRILMASASIRLLFKEVKLGISDFDLQELINKIMEQYELHEAVQRRPKVMFEFVSLVRSAFVARKDFLNLEPFLVFHADRLFSKEQFVSKYPQLKARLVYFLAHTYYRNRNFPASLAMIETLLSDLEKLKKRYQSDLFPKAILLKAAVQSFSDQNEKSIEILNEAAETEFFKRSNADRLNLRLNLAVYYFQEGDFRLANKMLLQLPNTDKWCERTMGQEWMLKRSLIEMITQVEMGNTEIALNRIRSIQRKYRSLMERPKYELVKPFLQVVKSVVAYPERINQKMYTDKIRPTFVIRDSSEEDLQAMTYYAWLKSKFAERPYYETLLELVNR
jgi:hypothetical protein